MRTLHGQRLLDLALRSWTFLGFVFLYAPIAVLVVYSFNNSRFGAVWQGFTFKWYEQLLNSTPIIRATQNSLIVAAWTTLLSVVLGTLAAWLLHKYRYAWQRSLQTLLALPIVMPEILLGASLLILFSALQYGLGYSTIIIAHTTFCFPFVMITVQARLQGLDPALEEAAQDLGAKPWQAVWWVILPSLRPAILAGALMAFTLSMDEIIATVFTASGASATLPLRIYGMAKVGLNPMLNAISTVFILATVAFVLLSHSLKQSHR